jgi:hypothetical protein
VIIGTPLRFRGRSVRPRPAPSSSARC